MSLRPEAIEIGGRDRVPTEQRAHSLDGAIASVTYLGHSIVYDVKVDWMTLEVRTNPSASAERFAAGDEVAVWWDRTSDWVVPDDPALEIHHDELIDVHTLPSGANGGVNG